MARRKGGQRNRRPRRFFICLCCGAKRVSSRSDDSGTYLACDRCNTEYATEFRPNTGIESLVIPAGWIPTDHQLATWTAIPTDVKARWANRGPTLRELMAKEAGK